MATGRPRAFGLAPGYPQGQRLAAVYPRGDQGPDVAVATVLAQHGRRVPQPGDWVVQGRGGERWPVSDAQFRRTYRAVANE